MLCNYSWMIEWFFSHFLNYQDFYMSWIIHFELIKTIIQMLHIALSSIDWNTQKNLMLHIYIWMG